MTFSSDQWIMEQLIAAVSRLARPAEDQIAYLMTIGTGLVVVDELALELDDVMDAARAVPGGLSERQRNLIRALDDQLVSMSATEQKKATLWSQEALRNSPAWDEVRKRARAALVGLDG